VFSFREEFSRLRGRLSPAHGIPLPFLAHLIGAVVASRWRLTSINAEFAVSPTYPPLLAVPADISDEMLKPIFSYRSKGRISALSYLHPNGAALCRSSQPKPGVLGARCPQVRHLLIRLCLLR
jgi:hypothetical protein